MANDDENSSGAEKQREPLALTILEVVELARSSRSVIYEAMERGDLKAKKVGRRVTVS